LSIHRRDSQLILVALLLISHCGGSDGILVSTRPHPRAWGTFPKYLGHYARDLPREFPEETVFDGGLEEAVEHLTSRAAKVIGLKDRGVLKVGYKADVSTRQIREGSRNASENDRTTETSSRSLFQKLVLFDPETINSNSTFENPKQAASGVRFVVVNGRIALDEGKMGGQRSGRTIRLRQEEKGWSVR